ncbi:ankyrin-2-like isoform X2 [Toxorhynchites rutilus septentrionalis]|nr:ankyrin-2-like isoform X2 [Toxorhynchites rutilus septentrionalis]XP_055640731.1 ankyrin-2-like isoform X2 [Toxorhynchites rutilus septentrionalis]XP_055640732.1 ankyrin-2-like isoform X2 [Toxorhynchites rutilus septentrionalis]
MPAECAANPLQRSLADAIIRMVPMDELRILLACGAKVNEQVTQGLRPLHYAVWQNNEAAVNLLLVRSADIDAIDEVGYSALHLAAEHGYYELAKILLDGGCKVDYRQPTDDPYPRTTLCDEPLRLALRNRHYDVARLLLERGADPNKRYFFGSEINLATDVDSLELLLTFGANTEARDRSGITPLMRAVRTNGNMDSVLLLLQYGADVNAMTDARNDYRTVLHYAVLSGNASLVTLLIKQGARVDTPAPLPEPDRPSPLDLAVLRGDPTLVRILLENGANANRSNPIIGSPLHVACADNIPHRVEIMKMLLSYGADPNIRVIGDIGTNAILRPPLAELIASNEVVTPEELRLLLKHGARVILKTQYRDSDGLLNCLNNMDSSSPAFRIILEAAEEFDPCMIRRNQQLSDEQRMMLLEYATNPVTLKSRIRAHYRRLFGRKLPEFVPDMFIPRELKSYLLYEHSF